MHEISSDIIDYQGLIIYEISNMKFCSNIMDVSNIIQTTRLDFAPDYLEKTITKVTINNIEFPLVNIQLLLKLNKIKISSNNRLLFYESEDVHFLFLVEKIHHIVSVNQESNGIKIREKGSIDLDYIAGAIDLDGSETLILDLEKIGNDFKDELGI